MISMATKKIKKVPPTSTYRKEKLHGSIKSCYEDFDTQDLAEFFIYYDV